MTTDVSGPTTSPAASPAAAGAVPATVDPRGQRFAAGLTTLVLAATLLSAPGVVSLWLLAATVLSFTVGVTRGPARTPFARAFGVWVRPRLDPPQESEDARAARFAQSVGLLFTAVALAGYLLGVPALGSVAVGLALAAALLNAGFGFCLGCELYLWGKRLTTP